MLITQASIPEMDEETYNSLSPKELECLRFVAQGFTTHAIVATTGRSSNTIEKQIISARRKLGGLDRTAAARAVSEYESGGKSLVNQRMVIEKVGPDQAVGGWAGHPIRSDERPPELCEERTAGGFEHRPSQWVDRFHDMNPLSQVATLVGMAVGIAMLLVITLVLLDGTDHVVVPRLFPNFKPR